ncbi:MAG: recombinase family protein [Anaerolineae bacterium]|nr:recombinase family protein [Anaerolineae bacterium]
MSTKAQAKDDRDSLEAQERMARAYCEREGWEIVDVLTVPGHSRRYLDFDTLARDARERGIDAFDRLKHLLETHGFDVIVVRDGDRFARTQALHAYIVETIINSGAAIYTLADGRIDEHNFRMSIAMGGYRAAGEIDALVKRRQMGMARRAQRGLPARVPVLSHELIRDPKTGKPIQDSPLVVDQSKRRLLDDIANLLLEGVAWHLLEREAYERYGHINPITGQRYSYTTFYKLLYNPWFWGHSVQNHALPANQALGARAAWAYDPGISTPPDVVIYRNTHEPAYTGELAERVKAEMRRRELIRGRAKPSGPYAFSGLLVCDECNFMMSVQTQRAGQGGRKTPYTSWTCRTHQRVKMAWRLTSCPQRKVVPDRAVWEYVRLFLEQIYVSGDLVLPEHRSGEAARLDSMRKDIQALQGRIEKMILDKAEADADNVREMYTRLINESGSRLAILQAAYENEVRAGQSEDAQTRQQRSAIEELQQRGVQYILQSSPVEINQFMRRLLGKYRLAVREGKIVGLKEVVR